MITLITGGPGLGKTALAVKLLLTEYAGRPLFSNVRDLTLEHSELPPLEEWTREERNSQGASVSRFAFPPGAVVLIDECQQFFRPRSSGSRVPPYVSAFETHRQEGLDFILVTQGSRLLDANIRALVKGGRHIFLHKSYLGRHRYEKAEVIDEDDKTARSLAARTKYRLPKDVFHLYKSAELHTKPPRPKLPVQAFLIVFAVFISLFLGYRVYARAHEIIHPQAAKLDGGKVAAQPTPSQQTAFIAPAGVVGAQDYVPRVLVDPASAPRFDAVRQVKDFPRIAACVSRGDRCVCFSQQATVLDMVPADLCKRMVAGLVFDAYHDPKQEEKTAQASSSPVSEGVKKAPEPSTLDLPHLADGIPTKAEILPSVTASAVPE